MVLMGASAQSHQYDLNRDGSVNITDVTFLLDYVLGHTPVAEPVDLGLPSGIMWASFNMGATKPEESGGFYAWGETEQKKTYTWENYIHCDGTENTCHDLGSDISGTEYDVAHVKWGVNWRMPSEKDFSELTNNCSTKWTTLNGVEGIQFTSKLNGNSIFLPFTGSNGYADSKGWYWLSTMSSSSLSSARPRLLEGSKLGLAIISWDLGRYVGLSIRPIYNPHPSVDLGLPSGTKWASCNVGATKPEEPGNYFSWGEINVKNTYTLDTYKYYKNGSYDNIGSDISGTEYDVATALWGDDWCMPTKEQIDELISNCDYDDITINGMRGYKFTSYTNGNSIFLPAAGSLYTIVSQFGNKAYYWSSTLLSTDSSKAYRLHFESDLPSCRLGNSRGTGFCVRPVKSLCNTDIIDQSDENRYDLNNDGDVNITDAILLVNYVLGNNQEIPSLQLSTNSIYINGDYSSSQRLVKIISGNGSYTVTSSNNSVAAAEIFPETYVTLTIKGLGETTITVYDEVSGETATIKVVVMTLPQIPGDSGILLAVGQRDTIEFTFDNPEDYEIEITDPSIATVEKNNNLIIVKGISEGYTHLWVSDTKNGTLVRHYYVRVYLYCPDDNHPHMIDLGLPSGTKWACCNVGASRPEAYGGYYAWGESVEKAWYSWDNYDHCILNYEPYWNLIINDLGEDIAGTQYDVAHVKWGESWVMPNNNQHKELIDNCKFEWTELNGVKGCRFTGLNGCRIFMPAAGFHPQSTEGSEIYVDNEGDVGAYWSSTQCYVVSNSGGYNRAYNLRFWIDTEEAPHTYTNSRINGMTVRPVANVPFNP